MKEITLTRGRVALVDEQDYAELSKYKWFCLEKGYAVRSVFVGGQRRNSTVYMHRQILDAQPGQMVDHINGNKLDNRRCNLRFCTVAQNSANSKVQRGTRSGFKGVHESRRGQIVARIKHKGRKFHLGVFKTREEAARAYDKAALELFGEFARLNFPESA